MKKLFPILACVCFSVLLYAEIANVKIINGNFKVEDFAYDTHIDAPDDINAKNAHVERRLSEEEKAKYYAAPLKYMEAIAQNDWQRALELSMYYQGWKPNTMFFRFDFEMRENFFNKIPTTDDMRFITRESRDKQKALEWAEKSFELAKIEAKENESFKKTYYHFWNHANASALNLLYRYEESDLSNKNEKIEKLLEFINDNRNLELFFSKEISNFKKNGNIRFDLGVEKLHFAERLSSYWRNYYCGFIWPKNKDFSCLILIIPEEGYSFPSHERCVSLVRINSGFYDKEEYSPSFVKAWAEIATKSKKIEMDWALKYLTEMPRYSSLHIFPLSRYSIKYFRPYFVDFRSEIVIENPYYNKAKAFEELKNIFEAHEKTVIRSLDDPIFQFITYAPQYGISEEDYNEIIAEIRKHKRFFNYYIKEEKSAREWFSGRIPNAEEYR